MIIRKCGRRRNNYSKIKNNMPKKNKTYSIGIDVGGTKMRAVLFDGKKVIMDYLLGTPLDNVNHFLIMLKALVDPLKEKAAENKVKVMGVGLGIAGVIDYEEKKMLYSPNIPIIDNVKIPEKLELLIGLPVVMDHDVNCFLRAEMTMGAGENYDNVYGIIIGTGIGGAWWRDGGVYRGSHGGAGEPGRMIIDIEKMMNLEEAYHRLTQNNPGKMAQEAYYGDRLAEQAYAEVGEFLGIAFANIVNIVDPEVFILGGGAIRSSELFFANVKKFMRKHIDSPVSAKKIRVLKSKLKENAGAIGAALLV